MQFNHHQEKKNVTRSAFYANRLNAPLSTEPKFGFLGVKYFRLDAFCSDSKKETGANNVTLYWSYMLLTHINVGARKSSKYVHFWEQILYIALGKQI